MAESEVKQNKENKTSQKMFYFLLYSTRLKFTDAQLTFLNLNFGY